MFDWLRKSHGHCTFTTPYGRRFNIDDAVKEIFDRHDKTKDLVLKLQSEINLIHAHYRDELCSDCCHVDVCAICPSVKYGYECEDRTLPCFLVDEIENDPPATCDSEEGQK